MRTVFLQVAPGLEQALADEVEEIGLEARPVEGGVEAKGDVSALQAVHLHSRVAARVLVRAARFRATTLEELARHVRQAPWSEWVHPRQPVEVRVTAHESRLRHRESTGKKVEHAIADALRGPRIPTGRPPRHPVLVLVRLDADMVEVSVDASGELLHRRGWRQETAKAPLRENLAAAILRLAQWQPGEPLVDPMCGSGTFPIEAATIALGLPPGARRGFAFETWPCHDAKAWAALSAQRLPVLDRSAPIVGADRDAGAIEAARGNAGRARVTDRIRLIRTAFAELEPPAPKGLLVANPPYGKRVGGDDPAAIYAALGRTLRQRWVGWRVALLVPDPRLLSSLGLRLEEAARFPNGGIRVGLYVGEVEAPRSPT